MSLKNNDYIVLSRKDAKHIHEKYPHFFRGQLNSKIIVLLAECLGITVSKLENSIIEGRLEEYADNSVVIYYSRSKSELLTLSHEIGHWILLKKYAQQLDNYSLEWKESYANRFSIELCIPFIKRNHVVSKLNNTKSILDIILIAKYFDLSINNFIKVVKIDLQQFYKQNNILSNIWILAKFSYNIHTKQDLELRVINVLLNESYFFIPTNRRISNIFDDTNWISNLVENIEYKYSGAINISVKSNLLIPKFSPQSKRMECTAIKIYDYKLDSPIFIFLVNLLD